ncbi:unnamed protein product [Schistosoma curassoni]|nr:unnamed protein product [Schistosoma curassoni]
MRFKLQLILHNYYKLLSFTIILLYLFHLNKQVMTLNFNEILLRDSELLKVLSTLKGIPKNMTIYELIDIRKTIPNIVENWINFMNNEQFLHDYEYGKISKDVYHDLQKSIVFLRIVPCELNIIKQLKSCFIIQPSLMNLNHKIHLATLSTYIHSWINPNQLILYVYLMNSNHQIYEHFYIHLNNKLIKTNIEYLNIKSTHRQVIWDISLMIKQLQYSKYDLIDSIIMTLINRNDINHNIDDIDLNYIDLSNEFLWKSMIINKNDTINNIPLNNQYEIEQNLNENNNNDNNNLNFINDHDYDLNFTNENNNNYDDINEHDDLIKKFNNQYKTILIKRNIIKSNNNNNIDNILSDNTQIILEMKTLSIIQLENQYLLKKRLIQRSFLIESTKSSIQHITQSCPSFLDKNKYETKCCLFRYTLNKMQMDQNDKLRFIIFPHHLPINMCHGRCIGLYMPTDNAHSILMNRYFSGLGSVEREAIYNSMPCCAANETIPFTILYKDHKDQLVTETLPKAVKTNCACS